MDDAVSIIRNATVVFWDFDGVIKESHEIKYSAYEKLFQPYGSEVASRIRSHQEAGSGVSRLDNIPLYMEWSGEETNSNNVNSFLMSFSRMVKQEVINAPWVKGVRNYLLSGHKRQIFVLVSATPQDEMQLIVEAVGLGGVFAEIYGAPTSKAEAILSGLKKLSCDPEQSVMIGDSWQDMQAARKSLVPFILRRNSQNEKLQRMYTGSVIGDFSEINFQPSG